MGLDWVVLARRGPGGDVNPTEVIGAKRASDAGDDVLSAMRAIWAEGRSSQAFEAFVAELREREVPPVVIPFGLGFNDARPAVQAEGQYYGYRAKALEPEVNRVTSLAVTRGNDFGWLWAEMATESHIFKAASVLAEAVHEYEGAEPGVVALARRYYAAWRGSDEPTMEQCEAEFEANPDLEDHVFEVFACLGAVDWLRFWSTKGFPIVPEF